MQLRAGMSPYQFRMLVHHFYKYCLTIFLMVDPTLSVNIAEQSCQTFHHKNCWATIVTLLDQCWATLIQCFLWYSILFWKMEKCCHNIVWSMLSCCQKITNRTLYQLCKKTLCNIVIVQWQRCCNFLTIQNTTWGTTLRNTRS